MGMAVGEGGTYVAVSSNSVDSLTRTNFTSPWFKPGDVLIPMGTCYDRIRS